MDDARRRLHRPCRALLTAPPHRNFFPVIVTFLRSLPVIGPLLNMPGVSHAVDRLVGHVLPTHSA